ncbi:hypothetical protein D4R49_01135 [bacterium]|nr:MAG: hypothetical protein D4R49_01135 [bacterium]
MPQNKNSQKPEVMTWGKAAPVLIFAGIFDLIRMFFEMFWLLGPVTAGILCTVKVNDAIGASVTGTVGKVVAGACTAGAATFGALGMPWIETFGIIMADAFGLIAFLVLGFWIVMKNPRIFKANASAWLWMTGSLGVSVIPLIGTLPAFFVVLRMLYSRQIKVEKAALARWEKENAAAQLRERQRQQQMQQAQLMQTQANQFAMGDV